MSWLHAHFSKDLAFHAIFSFDPKTNGRELSLAHGYVVEKGRDFRSEGSARRTTKRARDRYADTVELILVDSADREWKLQCEGHDHVSLAVLAQHGFVQRARPLARADNLTGYGEIQDFFEMPQLTALNSDSATRVLAGVAG